MHVYLHFGFELQPGAWVLNVNAHDQHFELLASKIDILAFELTLWV